MNDPVGFKSHQPRAGCIGSHRVVRKHNSSQRASGVIKGPVSLHRYNAVCDNEVDGHSGTQIKDALLNALPILIFFVLVTLLITTL